MTKTAHDVERIENVMNKSSADIYIDKRTFALVHVDLSSLGVHREHIYYWSYTL